MTARAAVPGPPGPPGAAGRDGAPGTISGLVLTTPPNIAFGRELGQAQQSGNSKLVLTTTAAVNPGETIVLVVGWDPQVIPNATTITSVIDSQSAGTWTVDMTNDNVAVPPVNGPSYLAVVTGQVPSLMRTGSTITIQWNAVASDASASATAMIGIFFPGASKLATSAGVDSGAALTTALTSGSVTTVDAQELVISAWRTRGGTPTTFTPSSGFTKLGPSPTSDAASTHCSVDAVYKIQAAGAASPTATTNNSTTWTNVTGRYQQGVAWTPIPKVLDEKLWVNDPTYGAVGNNAANDTAALKAAFAAADAASTNGKGCVAIPPGTYLVDSPLDYMGWFIIEGYDCKNTTIKARTVADGGFTGSQIIRNWVETDWTGGETDHRTVPLAVASQNLYLRISGIQLDPGDNPNLSLFHFRKMQETSYIRDCQLLGGTGNTGGNTGTRGIDIQRGVQHTEIDNVVWYGNSTYGYDTHLNLDSSMVTGGAGAGLIVRNCVFADPFYRAIIYVDSTWDTNFIGCHIEGAEKTGALAAIYGTNARGLSFTGGNWNIGLMPGNAARTLDWCQVNVASGKGTVGNQGVSIRDMTLFTPGASTFHFTGGAKLVHDPWTSIDTQSGTYGTAAATQANYVTRLRQVNEGTINVGLVNGDVGAAGITPGSGDASTQFATTQMVQAAIAAASGSGGFIPTMPTGRWYSQPGTNGTGAYGGAGNMRAHPFDKRNDANITSVSTEFTVAAASSVVRIAIYADNAGLPGALLADCGTVATSGTPGMMAITGLNVTAAHGRYWLATIPQVANPTMRTIASQVDSVGTTSTPANNAPLSGVSDGGTSVTGAAPNPWTGSTLASGTVARVWVKC